MRRHDESGAADGRWLLQLVVVLAVLAVVVFEGVALASAGIKADAAAGDVLEVAEPVWERTKRLDATTAAAQEEADLLGVELVDVTVLENVLEVTVRRDAGTFLLHRFMDSSSLLHPAGTRSTGVNA